MKVLESKPRVLVAAEKADDLAVLFDPLNSEFDQCQSCLFEDLARTFREQKPNVLVLGGRDIKQLREVYGTMLRALTAVVEFAHHVIVSIPDEEYAKTQKLCDQGVFDDCLSYTMQKTSGVLGWRVRQALRERAYLEGYLDTITRFKRCNAQCCAGESSGDDQSALLARRLVFLVDDDPMIGKVARKLLAPAGFEVKQALTPMQALRHMRWYDPELILLDFEMPDLNGFEVLDLLKRDPLFGKTPILMLTSNTGRELVAEAVQKGARDFLVKPLDGSAIAGRLAKHIKA